MTKRLALILALLAAVSSAQSVVAPTPDRPDELHEAGGYTISNSFEVGYRWHGVGGNQDAYRSSVNYGNGVRLLEGQLRMNSADGRGKLFDEFSFRTLGTGGDPYQYNLLRAEKNRWYRYDLQLRRVEYFNRLPSLWQGERGLDSERLFQTHELRLLPGRRFEILLGYERNKQSGPGFWSEGIPNSTLALSNDNYLRYVTDLRRENNQYRAGIDFRIWGLAITAVQAIDNYKDDTRYFDGSGLPSATSNVQPVESNRRDEPIHGNTPFTTVAIRTEKERVIGFQGRYVYASGGRTSTLSQDVTALDFSGNPAMQQTFVFGDASRKQGSGDLTVTLLPSPKWAVTNTTAVNNTRIDGQASFLERSLFRNEFVEFDHLGIRFISSATEASFRPVSAFSVFGAYRYSTRRIRTREAIRFPDFDFETELTGRDNDVSSGGGGVRWTPRSGLRVSVDAEVGRADQPLAPTSSKRFHNETARVSYRRNGIKFSAFFKNRNNQNPVALVDYSSTGRSAGFHATWVRDDGRWAFDGGYTLLQLNTGAGIFNLFAPEGDESPYARSFYESNLHTVNFSARLAPHRRLTLYLAYSLAKDTGDGSSQTSLAPGVESAYPSYSFDGADYYVSFPLSYHSPQARVSVLLRQSLSFNLGWQYYGYNERFTSTQGYRAQVGYTSLRWSF